MNPASFENYEDRMMTCEQCHDRNSSSTNLATVTDARGFVVGDNLDDFRNQISPAWGTGSRNVSMDGKGRRGHQQNIDMRLARPMNPSSYHADQTCFDCHNAHVIGVNTESPRIKADVASCTSCYAFDASEAFDGRRGWGAACFGNGGTEYGRQPSKQHVFKYNEEGLVYGLSAEQYTWVLEDGGAESEKGDWQAIWPWRKDSMDAAGRTTLVGAEPWNQ